jgi:bifunctional non-homologous end joining protein LigD
VPDGIGKPSFYQKHVTSTLPPGFDAVDVPDKKSREVEKYVALSTREAVASLAQMSVLEVHPWGSLAKDLERADRLTIDLDPDESLGWDVLTRAAFDAKERLEELGLTSFVKTTGGKGLHVVVPIVPEMEWPQVKEFCHGFVNLMEEGDPKLYLTKMTKSARVGKIYLDYLRNERGATAVAPYSPRARANVGVAMPLDWAELKASERPVYRVSNYAEWGGRLKEDVWAALWTTKQRVSAKAKKAVGMKD